MIYVMSDLHGEFDKFIKMLKEIDFSPADTLYIIGDILDRGPDSIKIIDYIRKPENKNIHLILGNHELLFMMSRIDDQYFSAWIENGGNSTQLELEQKGEEYQQELFEYLMTIPVYKVIDKFILVHAGINIPENAEELTIEELMNSQDQDSLLWSRSFINSDTQFKDFTVICGHTPTVNFMQENRKAKILYSQGKIMIDCGAHFKEANGRLGCLRLDDLEEFYID